MRIESPPHSGYPGIVLRQLERRDLDDWSAYLVIPEVFQDTSWNVTSPRDLEPLFQIYESTAPTSPRRMAIVDQASDRLVGTIGFNSVSDVNRSAEVTYDLSPILWGRGIATVVCNTVSTWPSNTISISNRNE